MESQLPVIMGYFEYEIWATLVFRSDVLSYLGFQIRFPSAFQSSKDNTRSCLCHLYVELGVCTGQLLRAAMPSASSKRREQEHNPTEVPWLPKHELGGASLWQAEEPVTTHFPCFWVPVLQARRRTWHVNIPKPPGTSVCDFCSQSSTIPLRTAALAVVAWSCAYLHLYDVAGFFPVGKEELVTVQKTDTEPENGPFIDYGPL